MPTDTTPKSSNIKHIIYKCLFLLAAIYGFFFTAGSLLLYIAIARKKRPFKANPQDHKRKKGKSQSPLRQIRKELVEEGKQWYGECHSQPMSIRSFDGLNLYGEFVPSDNANSNKYVILIHGYTGSRQEMYTFGKDYHEKDYHVLFVDLRSHGNSEGRYITMGWLDRLDILKWIHLLVQKNPNAQIVLHGVSMGAATVMMTAGENLPPQVKACVEDCGYTSVEDIFASELSTLFHLPAFPFLYVTSRLSKRRAGYSFQDASCIGQLKKCQVPMLFIHGDADCFVPYDMMRPLYDACASPKEQYIVKGAGHVESRCVDLDAYNEKVFTFLQKYVK